jgi:ribosome-associated protein
MQRLVTEADLLEEINFIASRSSGAGGQNVNKVNTKVSLYFHIENSQKLTADEKELLIFRLKNKINAEGFLVLSSQKERTQGQNKKNAIEKLLTLLNKNLAPEKDRIPTKPTVSSMEERLKEKKKVSEKKTLRKKDLLE